MQVKFARLKKAKCEQTIIYFKILRMKKHLKLLLAALVLTAGVVGFSSFKGKTVDKKAFTTVYFTFDIAYISDPSDPDAWTQVTGPIVPDAAGELMGMKYDIAGTYDVDGIKPNAAVLSAVAAYTIVDDDDVDEEAGITYYYTDN